MRTAVGLKLTKTVTRLSRAHIMTSSLTHVKPVYEFPTFLQDPLEQTDPELHRIIKSEFERQRCGLELIASENFTSVSVLQCLGSCLTNKYSEGLPGKRYYGGTEWVDQVETLCQKRALGAFNLDEQLWGVNVQPLSGSPANFAVYTAILKPHDRIMGMHLPDGGHLSHGFMSKNRRVSATSVFWESVPYRTDPKTGLIDYEEFEKLAYAVQPKLIIAGFSCYPRHLDYKRFKEVADRVGAILLADISHISGLIATGLSPSPFEYAHIVTTTTHKVLRGPRSGIVFFRKDSGTNYSDLETKINNAIFPGLQGGPHNNTIGALATALKQVATPEYLRYANNVLANRAAMECRFKELSYTLATGGSDNHLLLVDLRSKGVDGGIAEKALEMVNISVNKNTCPGDTSVLRPSGIRVGTPALTTRGFTQADIIKVVDFIDQCLSLTVELVAGQPNINVSKFQLICKKEDVKARYENIKKEIHEFAQRFPFPGEF